MTYTAPTARALRNKKGSVTDKLATELGLIETEFGTVELGDIALNSGEMLVGSAANAATAVTPSGDVTVSNTGVMTIGSAKVEDGMMKSAEASASLFVGQGDGTVLEVVPSGAWTIAADGTATLADAALSPAKLALVDGHIIVGDASGEGADVAMSGDATIANTGAITIGAKKVTAAKTALTEGKVFIGASGGAAAEQTLSGDITVNTSGVTAIGSKKVGKAMMVSEAADVAGNIFVSTGAASAIDEVAVSGDATLAADGTLTIGSKKVGKAKLISESEDVAGNIFVSSGAAYAIDEVAVSGDATLAANGALTIADSVLEGSNVANVANANVVGGIPVVFRIDVADATGDTDVTSTHKVKIIDFWFLNTGAAAHASADTIQLKNGTNAITGAIAKTATQFKRVGADILDSTYTTISAGGTIRIAAVKDTNAAVTAFVMALRVA